MPANQQMETQKLQQYKNGMCIYIFTYTYTYVCMYARLHM